MIFCIWYPSGGFGHFVNSILNLYGKGFKRPVGQLRFSKTGDSHNLDLVAPKYTGATVGYHYNFDPEYNYSVLIDLGINSSNCNFIKAFPESKIIKICYNDASWPIVAQTMINKAMKSTIQIELAIDPVLWSTTDSWAQREKYFLFLRDHSLRRAWRNEDGINCFPIDCLLDYNNFKNTIEGVGLELLEFKDVWNEWYNHNKSYFVPVVKAHQVITHIESNENIDLTNITDLWTQAVIYYFIWLKFEKEVPHNDFQNFFYDTNQIRAWLYQ